MGLLPGLGEGHHYFCATTTHLSQAGVSGHRAFPSSHAAGTCHPPSARAAIAFAPESTPAEVKKGTQSFVGRWVSSTIAGGNPHLPLLHARHKPPKTQGQDLSVEQGGQEKLTQHTGPGLSFLSRKEEIQRVPRRGSKPYPVGVQGPPQPAHAGLDSSPGAGGRVQGEPSGFRVNARAEEPCLGVRALLELPGAGWTEGHSGCCFSPIPSISSRYQPLHP